MQCIARKRGAPYSFIYHPLRLRLGRFFSLVSLLFSSFYKYLSLPIYEIQRVVLQIFPTHILPSVPFAASMNTARNYDGRRYLVYCFIPRDVRS